jgi:serine protease inhibitor
MQLRDHKTKRPILLAATLSAAGSRIVPAMNAFATELYKHLTQNDANLIFSPFNIATALSMALAGARGGALLADVARSLTTEAMNCL